MSPERPSFPEGIDFIKDGRKPYPFLYEQYDELLTFGFKKRLAYVEDGIPVYSYESPVQRSSIWLISGVHGEEPAGPNAIAENTDFLGLLGRMIPIVIYPLVNPSGYKRDWRYFNEYRDKEVGLSVSDTRHYFRDVPPSSKYSEQLTAHILKTTKRYPPTLVIDLHEDESLTNPYVYFNGKNMGVPQRIIQIIESHGLTIQRSGRTDRGEDILDGVIYNANDESIDELLASRAIREKGKWKDGPNAKAVVVVETPTIGVPLQKRVQVHGEVIRRVMELI